MLVCQVRLKIIDFASASVCVPVCMCVHLTVCVCFKGKLACSPGTQVADVATDMVTLTAGYIIQTKLHGCTFDCLIHIISIETFVL